MRLSKLLLSLSLIAIALSSCKKDDSTSTTAATCKLTRVTDEINGDPVNFLYNGSLLTRLIQTDGNYLEFKYTGSNLDSVKDFNVSGMLSDYYIFARNSDGKISFVEFWDTDNNNPGVFIQEGKTVFEYSGNNVTKTTSYDYPSNPSVVRSYTELTYDAKGNTLTRLEYQSQNGTLEKANKHEYTYDDKKSFYTFSSEIFLTLSVSPSVNNMLSDIQTNYPSLDVDKDSLVYTYNSNNYPEQLKTYHTNGKIEIQSFTYDCN